jgi:hypothetical protein
MTTSVQRGVGTVLLALGVALFYAPSSVAAQELEPRAYRPLPIGLHFGLLVYSFSTGNVVIDPALPVEGLELEVSSLTAGYMTTFSLFGRSSNASVSLPYVVRATGSGALNSEVIRGSRSGPADARLRLTHLLIGGAAQRPTEFPQGRHRRTLGASLTVSVPTGNYRPERVVNAGANRWGFKPEIGTSVQRGRWINEIALGVWLFTPNHDGPFGLTKTQDPLGSLQFHFSYNFRNGMWLGLDGNYFVGGATKTGDFDSVLSSATPASG